MLFIYINIALEKYRIYTDKSKQTFWYSFKTLFIYSKARVWLNASQVWVMLTIN